MSNTSFIFDYLVVGVAAMLQQEQQHPYPDLFQHACNKLALAMPIGSYPRTLTGFLALLERPVKLWYPLDIPKAFDPDAELMYEGRFSEETSQYFYTQLIEKANLPQSDSTVVQQIALENHQFQLLLERLQDADDAERAQEEYVLLRSFLIKNPHTTTACLRDVFRATRIIFAHDVGELYGEDWPQERPYWTCDKCGPLMEINGQLRGIKPDACNDHRKNLPHVHLIPWQHGLRRINLGIHWRAYQPGMSEIQLFSELQDIHHQYPDELSAIQLWPGVDRYDLQLRFGDGTVWAVDVKDYRSPYTLAPKLTRFYGEGDLRYDESFYVFPIHRVRKRDHYIKIAREEATELSYDVHTVTNIDFKARVVAKVEELSKKRVG